MARLIDADEVMNKMQEGYDDAYGTERAIWLEAMKKIKELPTIEAEPVKQEWISVKDRLPEEDEEVLVYWDDGFEIGRYVGGEVGENIYWMPLPEPPKEGE